MALMPLDPSVIEQRQAEMKESLSASAVPGVNEQSIALLANVKTFTYGGKEYDVPRVPYPVGLKMAELFQMIRSQSKYDKTHGVIEVYERPLNELCELGWTKLVVPRSRWGKFKKWMGWGKNPLRSMSEAELADLISFFLARRMKSTVQFHSPATQETSQPDKLSQLTY